MGSMQDYQARHFLWEVSGKVATITLNRPERKNPLTFESYAELRDVFGDLAQDQDVRAVVITGSGGNFCSGGDVFEIIEPLTRKDMAGLRAFTTMTGAVVKAMRHCPQPVIAAVDGICAGAGAILAMASDIRIGTPRARTAFLFVRVGLAGCDMGACSILPRIIGHGRASELLYSGRFMEADEAERWGFFNRLVGPEQMLDEAGSMAKTLAEGPTFAHAVTKRQLHDEWDMSIDDAIDAEAEAQAVCMKTRDFQRAFEAFAAKQRPKFEGN
ncbi:MAG: enoyl-CoA hydratase family protein [Arenicellales bacterium]|nr:enoyl-CoA hydratase [Acidiferrobacteraceae bacterium]MDP6136486.1 enoyl-CoA hydratase family protein [Arenicellales bacterium]HCF72385.1 enoyl-CoA hydratase family protein [Gammaproteobacteria bacterium]MDP6391390.1 enoyl-CoA hydratase family protein [Arenicellales bacterium]MDP7220164.1 enoyl-CoA hydratase family protein [Arenicellales bacterium]